MLQDLDYKRIILAILLVIISIAMVVGVFWLVFLRSPGPESRVIEPGGGVGGVLPGIGEKGDVNIIGPGGILPESEEAEELTAGIKEEDEFKIDKTAQGSLTQVESVLENSVETVNLARGGFGYLNTEDDKFYRMSLDGLNKTLLAEESFPFVDKINWSPDGNKVILEYPDGANIVYDFTRNKKVTLPTGLEDPSWNKGSDKIAYKYIGGSEDDNWLIVSDSDGSNAQAVEPVGDQGDKVQVAWSPTNQVVALYHKPIGLNKEEVYFIGLNDENFKSLVAQGSNFQGIWSPNGSRILYHVINAENNYNPTIWIVDGYGDSIGKNNFNLGLSTWVDKCIFTADNKYVYCAVPINLPEGAGLYPDLLNDSADVFYRIDLSTGISKLIAYPILSEELDEFQVKRLFISDNGTKLYFLDKFTDGLYYLRLK